MTPEDTTPNKDTKLINFPGEYHKHPILLTPGKLYTAVIPFFDLKYSEAFYSPRTPQEHEANLWEMNALCGTLEGYLQHYTHDEDEDGNLTNLKTLNHLNGPHAQVDYTHNWDAILVVPRYYKDFTVQIGPEWILNPDTTKEQQ